MAYCKKCGEELSDHVRFCGRCGAPVILDTQNGENHQDPPYSPVASNPRYPSSPYEKPASNGENGKVADPNRNPKLVLFVVLSFFVVAAFAAAGILLSMQFSFKRPIKIDLNDYITEKYIVDSKIEENPFGEYEESGETRNNSYTNLSDGCALYVRGYNEHAYISEDLLYNVVDWDSLYSDLNEKISKKRGFEDYTYTDFLNGDDFEFSVNIKENIKNGDKISVTVTSKEETYSKDGVSINFDKGIESYEISALKEVNTFDPFKYVTIHSSGANHYGTAYIKVKENLNETIDSEKNMKVKDLDKTTLAVFHGDRKVAEISFYINEEDNGNISNGDLVPLYCECSQSQTLIDDYGLYIARYKQNWKITSLGDYITPDYEMSDEELQPFRRDAFTRVAEDLNSDPDFSDINFSCAYIADFKNSTDADPEIKNTLYVIYSYKYTDYWSDEVRTLYYSIEYANLVESGGKLAYNPQYYYYSYNSGASSPEELVNAVGYSNVNQRKIR